MTPIGLGAVCAGLAWHHAGLTREEKELVERAYLDGGVRSPLEPC
jgi:replicative superfamily II helicase